MNSARVVLVPLDHVKDPRNLPVLAVLVAPPEARLQPFPDVSIAIPPLQELAGWELSVQVITCVLRSGSYNRDVFLR